jgi:lipid II:glycine glycyltransferase (peptidoglycan interpeptide bridge formation enzyme)
MALEIQWTARLEGAEAAEYDRLVDEAESGHYAQTRAWSRAAVSGRPFTARYFLARRAGRLVGAALVLRMRAIGPITAPFAQVERGPVCALEDLEEVSRALLHAAHLRGVARLSVMPYFADERAEAAHAALRAAGFRDVQEYDGAHAVSLRVAIGGKRDEEILKGSEYKSLRYDLKHAAKLGATSRRGAPEDVRVLEKLYAELMGAQDKGAKPRAYYDALAEDVLREGKRGALFVCEHEGAPVSAIYVARHGKLATLVMGATSHEKKAFQKMSLPMLDAIRWARDEGCDAFDLGGIPLEGDTDDKRVAIARFKHDFAKRRVLLVREHARWF